MSKRGRGSKQKSASDRAIERAAKMARVSQPPSDTDEEAPVSSSPQSAPEVVALHWPEPTRRPREADAREDESRDALIPEAPTTSPEFLVESNKSDDDDDPQERAGSLAPLVASRVKSENSDRDVSPDDVTVPPVGDIAERFFEDGERLSKPPRLVGKDAIIEAAAPPSRETLKMTPEAQARRAHLVKYVRWAMASAAAVCALAILVGVLRGKSTKPESAPAVAAQVQFAPPQPQLAAASVEVPPPPDPALMATEAVPEEKAAAPAPTSDKSALEEKRDAQRLLEKNKVKDAIAAAERSVAIDPTDAEAWLLLGAARFDAREFAGARRAYGDCAKQAKKGPIGECRALLR